MSRGIDRGRMPSGKVEKPTDVEARYQEDFLLHLDGRVRVAKSLRERLGALVSDLGGHDSLSYQERSLCKRIVHLERVIEKYECTLAHGGTVDMHLYLSAINVLSGLYSKVGMKRRAKTLSLKDYLNAQQPAPSGPHPSKEDAL